MKLTQIAGAEKTVKQAWSLRESTVKQLALYKEFYEKQTGNEVTVKDVSEQMLLDFMNQDKAFLKFVQEKQVKSPRAE